MYLENRGQTQKYEAVPTRLSFCLQGIPRSRANALHQENNVIQKERKRNHVLLFNLLNT